MKQELKRFVYGFSSLVPHKKNNLSSKEAIEILESFWKKKEVCFEATNQLCCKKDLVVVIPAYNVENYIEKCLDSILLQKTTYSYSIVVVDDGSTDKTPQILEKYRNSISIIRQENRGLSGARNHGMESIDGRYIMFVDSDDYIPDNYTFQRMLDCAYSNDADLVICKHVKFSDYKDTNDQLTVNGNQNHNISINLFGNVPGFAWGKMYDSKLFEKICFPRGYWFEDTIVPWLIFPKVKQPVYCSVCGYAYRDNPKGISSTSVSAARGIETVWITVSVIEYAYSVGLLDAESQINLFLNQIYINFYRLRNQNREVKFASFKIMIDLYNKYFKDVSISKISGRNKKIAIALRTNDYWMMKNISRWL